MVVNKGVRDVQRTNTEVGLLNPPKNLAKPSPTDSRGCNRTASIERCLKVWAQGADFLANLCQSLIRTAALFQGFRVWNTVQMKLGQSSHNLLSASSINGFFSIQRLTGILR